MPRPRPGRSWSVLAAVLALGLVASPATALAQGSDPDAPVPPAPAVQVPAATPLAPPDSPDGTPRTVVQKNLCPTASDEAPVDLSAEPWPQQVLDITRAQQISTGAGQRVAVIDTGITPHPRLPGLVGLGDYVQPGPEGLAGLIDCDAHGTLVAGIIAASPDPTTAFVGVAPDAQLLSIRQSSGAYGYDPAPEGQETGVGDANTLARAVRLAVDQGATVINISESACVFLPDVAKLSDTGLGAALRYAVEQDVVVVAAAGNLGAADGGSCPAQNYDTESGSGGVDVVATPAWWDDYVLTVGSVGRTGAPSDFSLAGPWVDVAAPGEEIISLDPIAGSTGLANQLRTGTTVSDVRGTSFAAPYVTGTVALVRAAHPELDARQVVNRVEATAHPPAEGWNPQVGYGVIDPVAAVSDVLPADVAPQRVVGASRPLVVAPEPPAPDTTPRTVALVGAAGAAGLAVVTFAVLDAARRARRRGGA